MMNLVRRVCDGFWSPDVWLPPNTTWADIAPGARPDVTYADYRHLIFGLPLALVILAIRYVLERYWLAPVGKSLGIKSSRPKRATPVPELEEAYAQCSRLRHKAVVTLAKRLDMTERQIERWWRHRRAQDKPSTLVKFCENSWRCIYYTYSFIYGIVVLWHKPWLWNINHCWYGYPHQSVDNDIWWYYMISMAFYWSLTISQFRDVKRKDFWQMFVHHMVTLLLLGLSWVCNMHRVGSLVLAVHDCADIFLEAAKLTKYANYQKVCDTIFAIFTVVWIVTRLGFFPRILYNTSVEAPRILPMFPAYYIFNSLLILLLILHVVWTYLILQIAYRAVQSGQMEGDIRSSSSDFSESSENMTPVQNGTPIMKTKTPKSPNAAKSAAQQHEKKTG
ncbi:ceramide synthase 6 [Phlebotomus argentipes]|uniref:ceramide synthase 6 n=1 Tax=Phlebotomus argentipes TaxID=94469 RepID=UPI0028934121|nr:ceramide synthase 6 [Phlebotomus argentipes]